MSSPSEFRSRFAPRLAATIATVLLLWLLWTVADLLLLLFIAVILSLYLGAVTDFLVKRVSAPRPLAFTAALVLTLAAVYGMVALLVPPVVDETRQLIAVFPEYARTWQDGLARLVARYPALGSVVSPEGELISSIVAQVEGLPGRLFPTVVGLGHAAVLVVSVLVMSIYLALHPGLYREWLIALFPPVHRETVRDVLADMSGTLRSWIVAQLLAMTVLALLSAAGLYILRVPYWLTFGIFVGAVVIVPFFGTLIGTLLPALFVLGGDGYGALGPGGHFLLVVLLGVVTHIVEGNLVLPLITARKVEIPPVLTMMSVLVVARLFGVQGVVVAVPLAAVAMVLVRQIVIRRVYEGQGFRLPAGDRVLVLRVPAPDGSVIPGRPLDVLRAAGHGADGAVASARPA